MLTDGRTDGRTHGRTDDGRKVITIAHPEQSSGELKMWQAFSSIQIRFQITRAALARRKEKGSETFDQINLSDCMPGSLARQHLVLCATGQVVRYLSPLTS